MQQNPYIEGLKDIITQFDPERSNRYFVFGSAVRKENFRDIDLAVVGNVKAQKNLSELRQQLYDSLIPYKVDVVDFDSADKDFTDYVLHNEPLVWIS